MNYDLLEKNKAALLFAGVTIFFAVIFAASQNGSPDYLLADRSGSEREVVAQQVDTNSTRNMQPEIADFAPDSELIDDTSGFNPDPSSTSDIATLRIDPGQTGEEADAQFEQARPQSNRTDGDPVSDVRLQPQNNLPFSRKDLVRR